MESDSELKERYKLVREEHTKLTEKIGRMKLGIERTRKAMFAGCLCFSLLQIESELRYRKLID